MTQLGSTLFYEIGKSEEDRLTEVWPGAEETAAADGKRNQDEQADTKEDVNISVFHTACTLLHKV